MFNELSSFGGTRIFRKHATTALYPENKQSDHTPNLKKQKNCQSSGYFPVFSLANSSADIVLIITR